MIGLSKFLGALTIMIGCSAIVRGSDLVIPLWPHGAPGPKVNLGEERDTTTDKERATGGRRVTRLSNIT